MSNNSYKLWHTPKERKDIDGNLKKGATFQGYFTITNKEKYIGEARLAIYRSGWEWSFMKWCDFSPSIVKWSSEPIKVPYYNTVANLDECKKLGLNPNNPKNWAVKNYNVDFWIAIKKPDDTLEKWFIEIKPGNKLIKPSPPKAGCLLKEEKRFVAQAKEWLVNEQKWKAMNEFAKKNNAKFYVFTEKELTRFGILGGKFDYKG